MTGYCTATKRKVLPRRRAAVWRGSRDCAASTPARAARNRRAQPARSCRALTALAAVVVVIAGCAQPEAPTRPDPLTSRQSYEEALLRLGLNDTAAGAAWLAAGRDALSSDALAALPFAERLHFDVAEPHAGAIVFHAMRGQQVDLTVDASTTRFFMDVHYLGPELSASANRAESSGRAEEARLVAAMPRGGARLTVEPPRHGYYALRIQPELMRGGSVTVEAEVDAVYEWPVEGTDQLDVWSVFGDPRDGGRRVHHGIDIFAPRGTPILAVGPTEVARVSQRDRGGNVITLIDRDRNLYLYYAHLDEQLTERGLRVDRGDVIGTVGNTGNARTTPPHLHIGIYDGSFRRPLDPWYFFVPPTRSEPADTATTAVAAQPVAGTAAQALSLGEWVRVARGPVTPVSNPPGRSTTVPSPAEVGARGNSLTAADYPVLQIDRGPERDVVLPVDAPVRLIGVRGEWARIRTPDGVTGYLPAAVLGPNGTPTETVVLSDTGMVRSAPRDSADVLGELPSQAAVALHGRYGEFGLVLTEEERGGWVRLSEG